MPKINKRLVDALRPDRNGKDVFVWDAGDGALKGFGIRIKPSGAASYFVHTEIRKGEPADWCSAGWVRLPPIKREGWQQRL